MIGEFLLLLQERQRRLSKSLAGHGIESALIDDPVELYWLTGGRQNGILLIGADGTGIGYYALGKKITKTSFCLSQEGAIVLTIPCCNQEWVLLKIH